VNSIKLSGITRSTFLIAENGATVTLTDIELTSSGQFIRASSSKAYLKNVTCRDNRSTANGVFALLSDDSYLS
jgi:hypothetical protein